jgi:DNA-binding CsgD family transcriptional regulator
VEVVGRQRELAHVEERLDAAATGPVRLVLAGEPGIGKTTVWEAGLTSAAARGFRVLTARPTEAESALAYAGLADLLADVEEDAFASLPEPQRFGLDVALLRAAPAGRRSDPRAVYAGFCSVLTTLAGREPIVVAVDDLQWLDRPSTRALEFAWRRVQAPIAFLASERVDAGASTAPSGWPDEQDRLRLRPLGPAALHQLIKQRLDVNLPRPTLLRVHEACGGNAFFALQIARALVDENALDVRVAWPLAEDTRELVATRLAALTPAVRDALIRLAAAPRATGALVGSEELEAAEEAGLVQVSRASGRVRFAHPFFASAVYLSASPEQRRRIHAELAEGAETLERAHHLALATELPDAQVAAELDRAAELALARGAPEVAAELAERAAELTPASDARDAGARKLSAAASYLFSGAPAKAASLLQTLLDGTDDALRAPALHLLSLVRFREESFAEAMGLLHEAAERSAGNPSVRAAVELDLALIWISISFDHRPAAAHAAAAAEHAEQSGDEGLLASALAVKTLVDFLLGGGIDERQLARSLDLEDEDRPTQAEIRPSLIAGFLALFSGRIDDARSRLYPLRDRMRDRGQEADLPLLSIHLAWLESVVGDLPKARMLSDEALELAAIGGTMTAHALAFAALLEAHAGDADRYRERVAAALAAMGSAEFCLVVQWIAMATGVLELPLGNYEAVDAALERPTVFFEHEEVVEPIQLVFLPDKIEALVALGELERAERLTNLLDASGEHFARPATLATAARCRAVLHAARGDLAEAQASLERALAFHEHAPIPLEVARTLLTLGQVERRRKQKARALETLTRSAAICDEIGARLWAERARSELGRLGPRREADELTASEERVATLAASGLTNREIAATAFMSQKTVEAHLSRIYRKLRIRSRAQLARGLAERETAPASTR